MDSKSGVYAKLVEKQLSSEQVFSGKLLHVYRDQVQLPDQNHSVREYIKHPGAAVVIPYLGNQRLLFIKQYRYPVQQVITEFPAGKIDPGELPAKTMQRELAEETGYYAGQLVKLVPIHTSVGYSSEIIHLYWANQLQPSETPADEDENIILHPLPLDEALNCLQKGELTDAKTIIALFWAEKILTQPRIRQQFQIQL